MLVGKLNMENNKLFDVCWIWKWWSIWVLIRWYDNLTGLRGEKGYKGEKHSKGYKGDDGKNWNGNEFSIV